MKTKLGCLAIIVYLTIGFVQLLATISGIQLWINMPWILVALISLIIAYIPIIGTIAGIKGATAVWGWDLWPAIALFCGPYVFYIIAIAVGGAADLLQRKKSENTPTAKINNSVRS
ncbi:MAG TPA: hypothetical protein VF398_09935 [bacterium]|jgi:hypothetical protein